MSDGKWTAPEMYSFAETELGKIHYRLQGPVSAPLCVCCHGFGDFLYNWAPFAAYLVNSGYQVLTFDLFGRGYSDCPEGDQDSDYFAHQIELLLKSIGKFDQKIGLIGHSMGGAIVMRYADIYPDAVNWLVLVAPAGLLSLTLVKFVRCCSLLRNLMISQQLTPENARKMWNKLMYQPDTHPELLDMIARYQLYQLEHNQNLRRAITSTVLHFPLGGAESLASIKRVGQHKRPVLFLWGKDDEIVPFNLYEQFATIFPQAQLVSFDKCGHIPMHEHQDKFHTEVVKFIGEHSPIAIPVEANEIGEEVN